MVQVIQNFLLLLIGGHVALAADLICTISWQRIYDSSTRVESYMTAEESTRFTRLFGDSGRGASAAAEAFSIFRSARARQLNAAQRQAYADAHSSARINTTHPRMEGPATDFYGGGYPRDSYFVRIPPGYENSILRYGIEAHEIEHVIQGGTEFDILPKSASDTPQSFSQAIAFVRTRRFMEARAMRAEWEYFHSVPDQIRQKTIAQILNDPQVDRGSADNWARVLRNAALGFDAFLAAELEPRGYSARALMENRLAVFERRREHGDILDLSIDRKHADAIRRMLEKDPIFNADEKNYLVGLLGTRIPIREKRSTTP